MRYCWLALALVLSATPTLAAPLPTLTDTPVLTDVPDVDTPTPPPTAVNTATRTATRTGSPQAASRIKPELIEWPTPLPTEVSGSRTPACVLVLRADNFELECAPGGVGSGGGGCETVGGATRCPGAWFDDVVTVNGATFVTAGFSLTKNSVVQRCFAKTLATLHTSNSAGVEIGLQGAPHLWGTVTGVLNSTNTLANKWPPGHAIYADQGVRITVSGGGTFTTPTGLIRIVCFFTEFGGIP